jgi:hypothetical protein
MGKRKQYTNAEKVALARKASLLGCSIASVACGDGFTSIYRMRLYKKHKETRRKFSNQKQLESNHKDRTHTITKALILFCDSARSVKPPVPITVESISVKAKNIAAKLFVEYEENTTIMEAEEAEAIKLHLFSSTWCFKWLKWNNYLSN